MQTMPDLNAKYDADVAAATGALRAHFKPGTYVNTNAERLAIWVVGTLAPFRYEYLFRTVMAYESADVTDYARTIIKIVNAAIGEK